MRVFFSINFKKSFAGNYAACVPFDVPDVFAHSASNSRSFLAACGVSVVGTEPKPRTLNQFITIPLTQRFLATSVSRKIQEHLWQTGGRFDRLFVMSTADLFK